jgi:hypothetical protein
MFKCQPSLRDSVFFSSLPSTSCWATLSRPGNAGTRMISFPCLGWVLARAFSLLLCTGNVEKRGFFGEKPRRDRSPVYTSSENALSRKNPASVAVTKMPKGGFPGRVSSQLPGGTRGTLPLPRLLFPAIRFVIHCFDIGPAQNIFRARIAADRIQQLGGLMVIAGGANALAAQLR